MTTAVIEEIQNLTGSVQNFRSDYDERLSHIERRVNAAHAGFLAGRGGNENLAVPAPYRDMFNAAWAQKLSESDYGAAFTAYARLGGNGLSPSVQGSLSVGNDPAGGFLVPAQFQAGILSRIFEISPMRQICSIQPIISDALEGIYDASEIENGGWVAEMQSREETDAGEFGKYRIEAHEQYAQPVVTQKLLDDASIDIAAHLEGKISKKFARDEN
jgi:HK97 family phage major capsid protein